MTHYLTKEGYKELEEELEELRKRRAELSRRIQEAKELGDLSENADYTDAVDAQAFNENRILQLEKILQEAEIITKSNRSEVHVGSTVVLLSKKNGEQTFTVTGQSETNPAKGKISNESPIGKALIGKKKGETVTVTTPDGEVKYTIKNIQ